MHWELHHTEQHEGFVIKLYTAPEEDSPKDYFASGDAAADAEILRNIEEGLYEWFVVKVTASKAGIELGEDYLGGCCYSSVAGFMTPGGYWPDMRSQVIESAKAKLIELGDRS